MDKSKFLESIQLNLVDDSLVISYKNKPLGVINIDWTQLEEMDKETQDESTQPVQSAKSKAVKQYVEGCDLGWC